MPVYEIKIPDGTSAVSLLDGNNAMIVQAATAADAVAFAKGHYAGDTSAWDAAEANELTQYATDMSPVFTGLREYTKFTLKLLITGPTINEVFQYEAQKGDTYVDMFAAIVPDLNRHAGISGATYSANLLTIANSAASLGDHTVTAEMLYGTSPVPSLIGAVTSGGLAASQLSVASNPTPQVGIVITSSKAMFLVPPYPFLDRQPAVIGCIPATDDLSTYAGTTAFPRLPAEVATIATIPGFTPSHIFGCQESVGGRIIDSVNNEQLVEKLLTGSALQFGVSTSLEAGARTAIRFTEGSQEALVATNNTLMSPFGGSVGWAVVFKATLDVTSRGLAGYGQGLTSANPEETAGIHSYFDSSGRLSCAFSDGLVGAGTSIAGGDICDDTWQIAGGFYNSVNGNAIHVNSASQHTRSLSPLTFTEMRQYFFVGGNRYSSQGMDVAYILLFEGASCELSASDYITALNAMKTSFLGTI